MYNRDTELLFPSRLIPTLRDLRGEFWRELVDRVCRQEPDSPDRLALVLLMVRLGSCLTCQADSMRALNGCTECARLTIRRFRGSDQDLVALFGESYQSIMQYLGIAG